MTVGADFHTCRRPEGLRVPGPSLCCAAAWVQDGEELVIPCGYAVVPARPARLLNQRFQEGSTIFLDYK